MIRPFAALCLFISMLCISNHANAQVCTSTPTPLGTCTQAGLWEYDATNKIYRYCNGSNFISMTLGTVESSCSGVTEGTLEYDTTINNFKFCNGTNWIEFASGTVGALCTTSGQIEYNTAINELDMCNGTNKLSIIGTLAANVGSVSIPASTTWGDLGASPGYTTQTRDITLTNDGTCDLEISTVTVLPPNGCGVIGTASGPQPLCPLTATNGFLLLETDCSGTLAAGATCSISVSGGVEVPSGGSASVNGTLTITTTTLTQISNLSFTATNGVVIAPL